MFKFEHTGLPANMLHATRNFVAPSPIQAQCWPIILAGRDLIGIAATGACGPGRWNSALMHTAWSGRLTSGRGSAGTMWARRLFMLRGLG